MKNNRQLLFCGDIHGEWKEFFWNALTRYKLSNADIVILGDFGIGFDKTLPQIYKRYEELLEKRDVTVYTIRGNHDNPKFFLREEEFSYPRLRFMEDYKLYELCGRTVLPIGGANSTDITWRINENKRLAKKERNPAKQRQVWWPGEDVDRINFSLLPNKVDIIISHDCPISFSPVATRFPETPAEQFEKILDARRYLESVSNEVVTDYWFFGHYHKSISGSRGRILYRCLDIMEFYEAPPVIESNPQGSM